MFRGQKVRGDGLACTRLTDSMDESSGGKTAAASISPHSAHPSGTSRAVVRPIRAVARWIYFVTGIRAKVESGLLVLDLSVCIPNFLFQRILGINRSCPWPVHFTSRVMAPDKIRLGTRSAASFAVSGGCYIQAFNGIDIGDDVIFAPGVKIISANHAEDVRSRHVAAERIAIGNGCWIGANAVILPGVTLGNNVIVGAGAVVTKSFPDNVVVAGNPARVLRQTQRCADGVADAGRPDSPHGPCSP